MTTIEIAWDEMSCNGKENTEKWRLRLITDVGLDIHAQVRQRSRWDGSGAGLLAALLSHVAPRGRRPCWPCGAPALLHPRGGVVVGVRVGMSAVVEVVAAHVVRVGVAVVVRMRVRRLGAVGAVVHPAQSPSPAAGGRPRRAPSCGCCSCCGCFPSERMRPSTFTSNCTHTSSPIQLSIFFINISKSKH